MFFIVCVLVCLFCFKFLNTQELLCMTKKAGRSSQTKYRLKLSSVGCAFSVAAYVLYSRVLSTVFIVDKEVEWQQALSRTYCPLVV